MADENTEGGLSLADLADIDVSNIEEVRFSTLPLGVFGFEVQEAELSEHEKDGERRFKAVFPCKVIEVKTVLEANVDKESLNGKLHTEQFFINPQDSEEDVQKSIGRIRAFVTDIGMDSRGKLGDIVRNTKGHVFTAKTAKQKDKNDKSIEYTRLKLDDRSKQKAA